jgi:hypothetical protein
MMNELSETIAAAWTSLPPILAATLSLVIGWLAAFALRLLVSGFLGLVRFDHLSERTGFSEFLRKGGAKYSPSKLVGTIAYWIVILVALYQASSALEPRIAQSLADKAIEMLPGLFAAFFVVVLGTVLVSFLANFALTIARNAGIPSATLIGRSIKLIGIILIVTVALEQIGLGKTILSTMLLLLFAALAFGTALAFGLGSVELARGAMQKFLRNLKERERGSKGSDLEG